MLVKDFLHDTLLQRSVTYKHPVLPPMGIKDLIMNTFGKEVNPSNYIIWERNISPANHALAIWNLRTIYNIVRTYIAVWSVIITTLSIKTQIFTRPLGQLNFFIIPLGQLKIYCGQGLLKICWCQLFKGRAIFLSLNNISLYVNTHRVPLTFNDRKASCRQYKSLTGCFIPVANN